MKKLLFIVSVFIIIVGITGCGKKAEVTNNQPLITSSDTTESTNTNQTSNIDIQKAKEIALADAGFSENEVTDLSLETDNNESKYDISFKNGGKEYDYDISFTGDIITKEAENDD